MPPNTFILLNYRSVVLKLEYASGSNIGLVKTKIAGIQPRVSGFIDIGWAQNFAFLTSSLYNTDTVDTETTL